MAGGRIVRTFKSKIKPLYRYKIVPKPTPKATTEPLKAPLPENLFVERHRDSIRDKLFQGNAVYLIVWQGNISQIDWSGEDENQTLNENGNPQATSKYQTYQTLVSHPTMDSWGVEIVQNRALEIVSDYYARHPNEYIDQSTFRAIKVLKINNNNMDQVKMAGNALHLELLEMINGELLDPNTEPTEDCALKYIFSQVEGKEGFIYKCNTLQALRADFESIGIDTSTGISIDEMKKWIIETNKNISLHAFDSNGNKIAFQPTPRFNQTPILLTFSIHQNHLYPIKNDELTGNRLQHLKNLLNAETEAFDQIRHKFTYQPNFDYNNFAHVLTSEFVDHYDEIINQTYKPEMELLIIQTGSIDKEAIDPKYWDSLEYMFEVDPYDGREGIVISMAKVGNQFLRNGYNIAMVDIKNKTFRHPKSTANKPQFLIFSKDFKDRETLAKLLSEHYEFTNFKFNYQSNGMFANTLRDIKFDNRMEWRSNYNPVMRDHFDRFQINPLWYKYNEIEERYNIIAYDINKSYPTAIVKFLKDIDIPIYSVCDNEIEFKDYVAGELLPCGKYFCEAFEIKEYGLKFPAAYYPHFELNEFIRDDVMPMEKIRTQCFVKKFLKGNEIVALMEEIFNVLPLKYAKQLAVASIGIWNCKYRTNDFAFITDDYEWMVALLNQRAIGDKIELKIQNLDGYSWVRCISKQRLQKDYSTIYEYVIGAGHLNVYEMIKKLHKPELRLIGIKTDCVIFEIDQTALTSKVRDMNKSIKLSNGHWTASGHYQYSDARELMFPQIKEMDCNNNDIISLQTILQNPYKSIQTSPPNTDPPNTDPPKMDISLRTK